MTNSSVFLIFQLSGDSRIIVIRDDDWSGFEPQISAVESETALAPFVPQPT